MVSSPPIAQNIADMVLSLNASIRSFARSSGCSSTKTVPFNAFGIVVTLSPKSSSRRSFAI